MDIKSAEKGPPEPTRRDWADRIAASVFVVGSAGGVVYVVLNPVPVQPTTTGSVTVWDRIFASPEITLLWVAAVVVGSFLLAAVVQRVIMGRLEFKAGPVENAPLPDVIKVRGQVDTAISAEVERLKAQWGTWQKDVASALNRQVKITTEVVDLLESTGKDVAELKQAIGKQESG